MGSNLTEDGDPMKHWTQQLKHFATPHWLAIALLVFLAPSLFAQETTGGIQGTVKDPTGAVIAPMAHNEPLAGYAGGTGGSMPGSSGNGHSVGYSIGGAADSESSYLVEGQDTENISGGYSKANVPMDFIQEVQIKTSGVSAEYGGALGGVINVIMKKGSNDFHGGLFTSYEGSAADSNQHAPTLRYDPTGTGETATQDPNYQIYVPKKDTYTYFQPGFYVGGPILKDKIWFFAGLAPMIQTTGRDVDFSARRTPLQVWCILRGTAKPTSPMAASTTP
jgi:hypothetical protein